jgi:quercetin dioxygenase-like cupin family protein
MTTTATEPSSALPTDIWFAGSLMTVLADHGTTGGQFALVEQRAARGFSPPVHVHRGEDQFFYVLAGAVTARLGDAERRLGPGDTQWLPRGTAHTFRVDSDEARLLEITTPAGFEQFHVELSEPAAERRIPDPAPLDVGALAACSARYGCDIIGPPMDPA